MFTAHSPCQEQHWATIIGIVQDDSTEAPLENVNVFLAHTTLGRHTGLDGRFEIKSIPHGGYDIVTSRLGYIVSMIRTSLSIDTLTLKITLKPVIIPYGEVTVSATVPEQWLNQLERFRKVFLGSSPNAKKCKIINPEVLDFAEEDNRFSAAARAPLKIENEALGYCVTFFLRVFRMEPL